MTRVIAGRFGGRRLQTPQGDGTRPTSDRVRESMFASVQSALGGFEGLRVLDVFAGSGALGIEALSRGAQEAVFVEHDRRAAAVIRANLRDLGLGGEVMTTSAVSYSPSGLFDLILCDPPYAFDADELSALLATWSASFSTDALVVVERSSRGDFAWPEQIEALRDKKYGETRLWYGRCHG